MHETELKIMLDAESERRLRRHPALAAMREGNPRSARLVSVYFDTPDQALARAGIALRLRREHRRWLQTVKIGGAGRGGLFSNVEIDFPAPKAAAGPDAGRPRRRLPAYRGAARRTGALGRVRDARSPDRPDAARTRRGLVEFALDRGEIIAGALSAPIREAELELAEGQVTTLFDVARKLFDRGPVRFSRINKAARGRRLAEKVSRIRRSRRARRASRRSPRRPRSSPWRATSCATASRRSRKTWSWSRRAMRSRGRTSCGSVCGGCARRFRSSDPASEPMPSLP
jgi:triphosphatase